METIKTDLPLAFDRPRITREIADYWNRTSRAWQTIWGPHIHHGYFEHHRETPVEAQEKLIEKLLALLAISPQATILDVGCGMGGSSLYLAKNYHATVTGITLSQKQVDMATRLAGQGHIENVTFKVEDALSMASFADNSFDVVWSLESCEQFYDKPMFIRQAFRVLKPGGRLMLATWCSGADEYAGRQAKQYRELCVALQLPYMPTINRYATLLQRQGFVVGQILDWSANVKETWTVGLASLRTYSFFAIFRMSGWRGLLFASQGRLMQQAFNQDRVKYGVLVADKP
ncbi:MAG: methyltransferase domain-containing protein [Betaproteobacteria bacterium]|nr:MAG: methyltransferase domain-containing protein [Betaproteobacteria bacterium]